MDAWSQGTIVTWDTKPTKHERLKAAMDAIGVGDLCPPPYSVGESLKRALQVYARGHRSELLRYMDRKTKIDLVVQRHEKADDDGYEIVAIERGKSRNSYTPICGARVVEGEAIEITEGYLDRGELVYDYRTNRATVAASAIGQMLVKVVQLLHGTCVRSMGGLYYLPEGTVKEWEELCNAVEEPDGTQITYYEIRLNASNMRAIGDAITKELMEVSVGTLEEICDGELGKRALENREQAMAALRAKMLEYESILDSPLQAVREALEKTETAIAMAKMAGVGAEA